MEAFASDKGHEHGADLSLILMCLQGNFLFFSFYLFPGLSTMTGLKLHGENLCGDPQREVPPSGKKAVPSSHSPLGTDLG